METRKKAVKKDYQKIEFLEKSMKALSDLQSDFNRIAKLIDQSDDYDINLIELIDQCQSPDICVVSDLGEISRWLIDAQRRCLYEKRQILHTQKLNAI